MRSDCPPRRHHPAFPSSGVVSQETLTPVGPNIHANKAGYEEIADTFEGIVDPR